MNRIKKIVTKRNLDDPSAIKDDLTYWLNRPPEERRIWLTRRL